MKRGQQQLPMTENGRVDIPYFAYGSNLHLEQMAERCPGSVPMTTAVLRHHELTYRGNRRGNGVANIEPKKEKTVGGVWGALYRISQEDLAALDRYEGYPALYYRDIIEVETKTGTVQAFAYFMHSDRYEPTMPWQHYHNTILHGYRHWGLNPHDLIDRTAQWKAVVQEHGKPKPNDEEELV